MRLHTLLCLLLVSPSWLAAQTGAERPRWVVGFGSDVLRFSGGIRDTASSSDAGATLRPNTRLAIWASFGRNFGEWEAAVELGWTEGHASGINSAVSIEDRTSSVNRYRIAPWAGLRAFRVGTGRLQVTAGPTFDRWTVEGQDRWRVGGEARVSLRLPLGAAEWENRLSLGASRSPITRDDAGEDFDSGVVRVLAFGAGLRFRL